MSRLVYIPICSVLHLDQEFRIWLIDKNIVGSGFLHQHLKYTGPAHFQGTLYSAVECKHPLPGIKLDQNFYGLAKQPFTCL